MTARWTFFLLMAWAVAAPLPAREPVPVTATARPAALTPTVKVAGMAVSLADVLVTRKPGAVHALWDAFPYKLTLAARTDSQGLTLAAQAMLQDYVKKKYPDAPAYKLLVVEYPERDSYGAPRYDLGRIVGRFELVKGAQGFKFQAQQPAP